MGEVLDIIAFVVNLFIIIKAITSAIMCVYGYKWHKGLIATMSTYIGFTLGCTITYVLLESGAELECIIIVPICTVVFAMCAYKVVWLNHFAAGYLLVIKITYMILYILMDNGIIETDGGILFGVPIIIGFIAGLIICSVYNNYVVILCVAFIGATELVPTVIDLINKTLFTITGDIGFIFDPRDFILGLFGIDTISTIEVIGILFVFGLSFLVQRKVLIDQGIDLTVVPVDDRNLEE